MSAVPATVDCPQCGAPVTLPRRGAPLAPCERCRTLVVWTKDHASVALPFDGSRPVPEDAWKHVVALVCRLCGGPYPQEVADLSKASRCQYCGHPAVLPPTVRRMLALAIRKPSALPAAARRSMTFWAIAATVFLALVGLQAIRGTSSVSFKASVPVAGSTTVGPIDIPARARVFPYLSVNAFEMKDAAVCLKATLIQERTGVRRAQWMKLWDGAAYGSPASHAHAEYFFSESGRLSPLPPGRYLLELSSITVVGAAPKALEVEMRTMSEPPTGMFILTFNALLWLFLFDLRGITRSLGADRRSRVFRWIAAVLLAALALEVVAPRNPFGAAARFVGRDVGPPPACGPTS